MNQMLLLVLLAVLALLQVQLSFAYITGTCNRLSIPNAGQNPSNSLWFKRGGDDNNKDASNGEGGFWQGLKRFLPGLSKANLEKSFESEEADTGNRYHVHIRDLKAMTSRHVITRLLRYLPDLTWETAEDIVDTAQVNGVSLVRVFNSRREAEYLVDMLKRADPAIPAEVYDTKTNDILP